MTTAAKNYDVADLALADAGQTRIEWADRHMPVLASIRERFEREKPLDGIQLGLCLHVTTETANLVRTLTAGGADVALCASNPLSTQDDVAAALVDRHGAEVYAIKGEDDDTYYSHINAVCDKHPKITMDDGADVIGVLHSERHRPALRGDRRDRGDDDRRDPPEGAREGGQARLPDHRRQRVGDQAPLRQPLRHGPVDARRHHPRDQRPDRGQEGRRGGVRLVRPRRRDAGEGPRRARDRLRGRPAARARGGDGRLRGDAGHRGRPRGRHLHHRDRRHACARRPALRGHEERRDRRQLRPLQRRDRHPGAREDDGRHAARRGRSSRSSSSATGGASSCSARAA